MKIGYVNPSVINDSIMTEKLRNRFCKDVGINIKFTKDRDLFMDRLLLCDENIGQQYIDFVAEVDALGGEQAFFELYNTVKDSVINAIKENPAYEKFISGDINKEFPLTKRNYPGNGIYKETNDGKKFLSIDLKKGNYSAMRFYNKSIVENTNRYEDFIGNFTNSKHIIQSKYIRQVIFGNCNPKRQTHIERFLMNKIFDMVNPVINDDKRVAAFLDDELVWDITGISEEKINQMKELTDAICKELDIETHFKTFNLEKIKDIYLLKDDDGKVTDTKCVNYITFPFIQRYLKGEPPKDSDYIFEFEGMKAKLLENPLGYEIFKRDLLSTEYEYDERE